MAKVGAQAYSYWAKSSLLKTALRVFKQSELSQIKYDPEVTPVFARPEKFIFLTFCGNCTGVPEDEGYLITHFKTRQNFTP
jgi:hypothetical protein